MRIPALFLLILTALYPTFAAAQATLNKCIDARGLVTYTNKPCVNAQEVHKVAIDPAPTPERPRAEPAQVQAVKPEAVPAPAPAAIHLETQRIPNGISPAKKSAQQSSAKQCDALSDKLGRVLDKMDQARRKGYTQKQMDDWNEEVHALEQKKQQSGCF